MQNSTEGTEEEHDKVAQRRSLKSNTFRMQGWSSSVTPIDCIIACMKKLIIVDCHQVDQEWDPVASRT